MLVAFIHPPPPPDSVVLPLHFQPPAGTIPNWQWSGSGPVRTLCRGVVVFPRPDVTFLCPSPVQPSAGNGSPPPRRRLWVSAQCIKCLMSPGSRGTAPVVVHAGWVHEARVQRAPPGARAALKVVGRLCARAHRRLTALAAAESTCVSMTVFTSPADWHLSGQPKASMSPGSVREGKPVLHVTTHCFNSVCPFGEGGWNREETGAAPLLSGLQPPAVLSCDNRAVWPRK